MAAALAACLVAPAPAAGQGTPIIDPVGGPLEFVPKSLDTTPRGFRHTAREVVRAANRTRAARRLRAANPRLAVEPYARLRYDEWAVVYASGEKILLQVDVDDFSGSVTDVWDGLTADFPLARGEERALAGVFYEPWVWLTFAVLFVAPFVDPRRPFRLLHLDLLMLLAFGVSHWFYERSDLESSVPLVYPVLGYLLVRMLVAGFRPRRGAGPLVPFAPLSWLVIGAVVLAGARVALNILEVGSVIDVGYVSAIGADRIAHGQELYVLNDARGDTYGPLAYLAYVPFELVFPYRGYFDALPAVHAAAITFDLLTAVALVFLGRRFRAGRAGTVLGLALAYAWLAYPYSLYTLLSNPNDGLVALLLVLTMLALASPVGRGLLLAAAALTKFAPAALFPLVAAGLRLRPREAVVCGAVFAVAVTAAFVPFVPDGGVRELYDTTLGFQFGRESPFSPWGQDPSLEPLKTALTVGGLLLAVLLAFYPRGRTAVQATALTAAVVIAVQLPAIHWFYFYVVWFGPLVLAAIFGEYTIAGTRISSPKPALPISANRPIVGHDLRATQQRRGPVLRRLTARLHSEQKGFTLIELLVVILIIGILAAIALPAFLGQRKKGQDSDAKSNARNLVSEVESCYSTNEDYGQCTTTAQLGETGLPFQTGGGLTPGEGQVGIIASGQGFTIVASSKSANKFSIIKSQGGAASRTCGANNSAGCKGTNSW